MLRIVPFIRSSCFSRLRPSGFGLCSSRWFVVCFVCDSASWCQVMDRFSTFAEHAAEGKSGSGKSLPSKTDVVWTEYRDLLEQWSREPQHFRNQRVPLRRTLGSLQTGARRGPHCICSKLRGSGSTLPGGIVLSRLCLLTCRP